MANHEVSKGFEVLLANYNNRTAMVAIRRQSSWWSAGTRPFQGRRACGHRPLALALGALLTGLSIGACSQGESPAPFSSDRAVHAPIPEPAPARPRVVVLGDSLAAGLGLPTDESFPSILQSKIDEVGYDFEVVNAGVSGDTSAGGLRRLDWALDGDVRVLIIALGANDGLRGLSVDEMRKNLSQIVERARERRIAVLLAGMEAPPNFGPAYTAGFRQAYRDVAAQQEVVFVPFLLDGVAGQASLNQRDGIHPNAEGARLVADHLWPRLQPMLDAATTND
jgi:acyl-CoA thioesterase-1